MFKRPKYINKQPLCTYFSSDNNWCIGVLEMNVLYVNVGGNMIQSMISVVHLDDYGCKELSFVRGIQATVHWLAREDRCLCESKATPISIVYLDEVHRTLQDLQRNSLNDWTCNHSNNFVSDDELVHLSCVAVFTINDQIIDL